MIILMFSFKACLCFHITKILLLIKYISRENCLKNNLNMAIIWQLFFNSVLNKNVPYFEIVMLKNLALKFLFLIAD
jgi:hypothetical protein